MSVAENALEQRQSTLEVIQTESNKNLDFSLALRRGKIPEMFERKKNQHDLTRMIHGLFWAVVNHAVRTPVLSLLLDYLCI